MISDEQQRRRAMRVDVRIAHQALKAMLPINRQIGPWQAKAVKLLAMGEKLRASGRSDPELVLEAEEMAQMIATHRQMLAEKSAELPPEVRSSSRVADTARALDSIAASLERALPLLRSQ
jgi:hypothetical protein